MTPQHQDTMRDTISSLISSHKPGKTPWGGNHDTTRDRISSLISSHNQSRHHMTPWGGHHSWNVSSKTAHFHPYLNQFLTDWLETFTKWVNFSRRLQWGVNNPIFQVKLHIFINISINSKWIGSKPSQSGVNFSRRLQWGIKTLCTIGMLHLISIVLMTGIQLKKKFSNWNYPVLTTTQNNEKLHIFYSNSLVILSIWTYSHGETCKDEVNVFEQES